VYEYRFRVFLRIDAGTHKIIKPRFITVRAARHAEAERCMIDYVRPENIDTDQLWKLIETNDPGVNLA
jgi:hypothetical protein